MSDANQINQLIEKAIAAKVKPILEENRELHKLNKQLLALLTPIMQKELQ